MTAPGMDGAQLPWSWTGRRLDAVPAVSVLIGGALGPICGPAAYGLARDVFHLNCGWGIGGEWGPGGTWVCGDGIGYLLVGVALVSKWAVLVLAGVLTALARPSSARSSLFLVLGTMALAAVAAWTLYVATGYAGSRPPGETGLGLWSILVLPALALCAFGLLVGAVGALAAAPWSPIVVAAGVAIMLVGTCVQPGIGMGSLVAAGLVAAAGIGPERALRT